MALKPTLKKTTKSTAATKTAASTKSITGKTAKTSTRTAPAKASTVEAKAAPAPKPAPVQQTLEAPKNDKKPVSFTYFAPQAGSVFLAGDFTRWETSPVALQKQDTGVWTTTLTLPPGRYQYRLLVDGQWQNDPECQDLQPNEFGSANCIRQVAA